MNRSIVELTKSNYTHLRAIVGEVLLDLVTDPDFGLELSDKAKRRLRLVRGAKKLVHLEDIKKKYF